MRKLLSLIPSDAMIVTSDNSGIDQMVVALTSPDRLIIHQTMTDVFKKAAFQVRDSMVVRDANHIFIFGTGRRCQDIVDKADKVGKSYRRLG